MEQQLIKLFDYQKFEKAEMLEKLIRETDARYAGELSDDDLSLVNAAGEPANEICICNPFRRLDELADDRLEKEKTR